MVIECARRIKVGASPRLASHTSDTIKQSCRDDNNVRRQIPISLPVSLHPANPNPNPFPPFLPGYKIPPPTPTASAQNGERRSMALLSASRPVKANFPSEHLTIAAGVAIFHLASQRVVLCYHTRDNYYFLPKGRRNAGEDSARGAEREGFEESGYRNRLLKLPMRHRQPDSEDGYQEFVAEPVWTQFMPLSEKTQYLLYWYIAETISPEMEQLYASLYSTGNVTAYRAPPPMPNHQTLRERMAEDSLTLADGKHELYEPLRHEGTAVDEEEALYDSKLVPVEEACRKLRGTVMEDVVRRGWEIIQVRIDIEDRRASEESDARP